MKLDEIDHSIEYGTPGRRAAAYAQEERDHECQRRERLHRRWPSVRDDELRVTVLVRMDVELSQQ